MDFRGKVDSFEEADHRYAELSRQREDGDITAEEFDVEAQQLMVREEGGRWWAKLGDSGEWHYRDGGDWIPGSPPGHQGSEGGASRQATDIIAVPRQSSSDRGTGKRRRIPVWIPIVALAGILLIVGVVAATTLLPLLSGGQSDGAGESMGVGQGEEAGSQSGQGGQGGQGSQAAGSAEGGAAFDEIFVHRATSDNISANSTFIDNPATNDNPDAVLVVTQNWNPGGEGGTYNDHSVGVWYESSRGRWAVFNQDRDPMTEDAAFNVAVR